MRLTKMVRVIISSVLSLSLALGGSSRAAASETGGAARTIVINAIEGEDVVMTKGAAKEYNARAGSRLSDGYTVATGKGSFCYLKLDENTILKMDEQSTVRVSKVSGNKLAVSVTSGAALVDAGAQRPGNSIETNAGNTSFAIRGTVYVIEYTETNDLSVMMIEGSGYAGGVEVQAGGVLRVSGMDDGADASAEAVRYEVLPLREVIGEETSVFALEAIAEHKEQLIESAILDEAHVELVNELIITREEAQPPAQETPKPERVVSYVTPVPEASKATPIPSAAPGDSQGQGGQTGQGTGGQGGGQVSTRPPGTAVPTTQPSVSEDPPESSPPDTYEPSDTITSVSLMINSATGAVSSVFPSLYAVTSSSVEPANEQPLSPTRPYLITVRLSASAGYAFAQNTTAINVNIQGAAAWNASHSVASVSASGITLSISLNPRTVVTPTPAPTTPPPTTPPPTTPPPTSEPPTSEPPESSEPPTSEPPESSEPPTTEPPESSEPPESPEPPETIDFLRLFVESDSAEILTKSQFYTLDDFAFTNDVVAPLVPSKAYTVTAEVTANDGYEFPADVSELDIDISGADGWNAVYTVESYSKGFIAVKILLRTVASTSGMYRVYDASNEAAGDYDCFHEAVEAVPNNVSGWKIQLLKSDDYVAPDRIGILKKNFTLVLNGFSLSVTSTNDVGLTLVNSVIELDDTGGGEFNVSAGDISAALLVQDASKITVSNVYGNKEGVSATSTGQAVVLGNVEATGTDNTDGNGVFAVGDVIDGYNVDVRGDVIGFAIGVLCAGNSVNVEGNISATEIGVYVTDDDSSVCVGGNVTAHPITAFPTPHIGIYGGKETVNVAVQGSITRFNSGVEARPDSSGRLTMEVSSAGIEAVTTGVNAQGATVVINSDIRVTDAAGTGVIASNNASHSEIGSNVTINGTLDVPAGGTYVRTGTTDHAADSGVDTLDGFRYSGGGNHVYINAGEAQTRNIALLDTDKALVARYEDFQDAIDACQNGYTMRLTGDVNCDKSVAVASDLSFTLDLNGKNLSIVCSEPAQTSGPPVALTMLQDSEIILEENGGSFNIKCDNGTGISADEGSSVMVSQVQALTTGVSAYYANVAVTGAVAALQSSGSNSSKGVYAEGGAVEVGSITDFDYAVTAYDGAAVTVNGDITSYNTAISANSNTNVRITGSVIPADDENTGHIDGIVAFTNAVVNVGGDVAGFSGGVYCNGGTVTVEGAVTCVNRGTELFGVWCVISGAPPYSVVTISNGLTVPENTNYIVFTTATGDSVVKSRLEYTDQDDYTGYYMYVSDTTDTNNRVYINDNNMPRADIQVLNYDTELRFSKAQLDEAFDAVENGGIITLNTDVFRSGGIAVHNKSITINPNGYTLEVNNPAGTGLEAVGSIISLSGSGAFNVSGRFGVSAKDGSDVTVTNVQSNSIGVGVDAFNSKVQVAGYISDADTGVYADFSSEVTVMNGIQNVENGIFAYGSDVTVHGDVVLSDSGGIGVSARSDSNNTTSQVIINGYLVVPSDGAYIAVGAFTFLEGNGVSLGNYYLYSGDGNDVYIRGDIPPQPSESPPPTPGPGPAPEPEPEPGIETPGPDPEPEPEPEPNPEPSPLPSDPPPDPPPEPDRPPEPDPPPEPAPPPEPEPEPEPAPEP